MSSGVMSSDFSTDQNSATYASSTRRSSLSSGRSSMPARKTGGSSMWRCASLPCWYAPSNSGAFGRRTFTVVGASMTYGAWKLVPRRTRCVGLKIAPTFALGAKMGPALRPL